MTAMPPGTREDLGKVVTATSASVYAELTSNKRLRKIGIR
jgi:hypothetical protein